MRLRTLGALSLEGCDFTRPKPLLLLAYLVVEGPRRRRHLAELFWPGGRDPMKSLTVALARLRSGVPGAVDADAERAWATVPSDVDAFLRAQDAGAAQDALDLYGGPFADGLHLRHWGAELEEWTFRTREWLAMQAFRACLQLAERDAADGRFHRASERAVRALRTAGATPEPEDLVRLHTLLAATRSPEARGVRREAEELGLALVASAEEARARLLGRGGASLQLDGIPTRGTAFVGRERELREARHLLSLERGRLLTIVGTAGVGKSRLALQVAREAADARWFEGGVRLVVLETVASPDGLLPAVADAVGSPSDGSDDPLPRVAESIGEARVLLVLDGFEHIVDGAVHLSALLARCPRLRLIATSRERLGIEEERLLPLAGLDHGGGEGHGDTVGAAQVVRQYEAVRLFERRARRADPSFVLDDRTATDVLRVCRLVEGLPLGLELAAAWVRTMPPGEIADEIARDVDFPVARTKDVPERHRSLRRAFEHSWRLLDEREQRVLSRTAVFQGGFRREAAREVAGAGIASLAALVDKSLLRVDRTGRYDRHPLLYGFVREKLESRPEALRRAEERHAEFVLGSLRAWEEDLVGGRQREALAAIEPELDNVQAAWRWAAAAGRLDLVWGACRPLQLFYIQRGGMAREGARTFASAADALDPSDAEAGPVAARLRIAEAWFRFLCSEFPAAEAAARAGVDGVRRHFAPGGDPSDERRGTLLRAIASGENTLGNVAQRRGDLDAAERAFRNALALAHEQGNPAQVAIFTNNLALLTKDRGRYDEAERLYDEALRINRRRGNDRSIVRNLTNLGAVKMLAGDPAGAERVLNEALAMAREIGFDGIVPNLLLSLGDAARIGGDAERARSLYGRAMARAGEGSERTFEANVLAALARVEAEHGSPKAARRAYARALDAAWKGGDLVVVRGVLLGMAELRRREGDVAGSARLLSLVRDDGGVPREVGERIASLLDALRGALPAPDLVEALARGRAASLGDAVDAVLREAGSA